MQKSLPTPLSVSTWVWYTTAGWFTGFVFTMLIIFFLEAIALGIGDQSMIGIGMGAGVGLLQARLLRRYGISASIWFWSSFVGMSVPYIAYDLVAATIPMRPEEVLPIATAIGALLAGGLQYHYQLKPISGKSGSWILLTCAGWTLAHFLLYAINVNFLRELHLPGFLNVFLAVAFILGGGPVLGLVTGRAIVSILGRHDKTSFTP